MKNMQRISLLGGALLALLQTSAMAATTWNVSGARYAPDEVLVQFKTGVSAAARSQTVRAYGAQSFQTVGGRNSLVVATLTPDQTVESAVAAYANDPNVAYAQPNYIYHASAVPNDPQYGQLWAAKNNAQIVTSGTYLPKQGIAGKDMNLEAAWNINTDCSSVVIAVVDSGINYNSTDLINNMWTGNAKHGQNFAYDVATGAGSDPMDRAGHGTHVAGTIAAQGNNGIGVAGVCWTAKLMAVRVLDATGSGSTSSIIAGVNYAVTNGAKIINMSLGGGGGYDPAFASVITNAQNNGVVVVVAAGNENTNNDGASTPSWPCNFTHPNLICVAALDQNYALASFSNRGVTSVDVGAPGTNIVSTWPGTNATYTDFVAQTTAAPAIPVTGWTYTSTTVNGWGEDTLYPGWLNNPAIYGGAAKYKTNTTDRAYKTFNLTGDVAIMKAVAEIHVLSGDVFSVNYMAGTGDPFVNGFLSGSATNTDTGTSLLPIEGDITPCITLATAAAPYPCSIGVQMKSAVGSAGAKGVSLTAFSIETLTYNSTSYHTIDGTSMATPQVAGVAALVWAQNPQYTALDVVSAIKNGGRATPSLAGKTSTGKAVDALGAITYINAPTGISVGVQ
jgi:subtilisin family serine protease